MIPCAANPDHRPTNETTICQGPSTIRGRLFGGLSELTISRGHTSICPNHKPGDSRVRTNDPRTARRRLFQSA
jgi:hypothetical protein